MKTIVHWILSTLAVIITAYLLPADAIYLKSFFAALVVAVVLGLLNTVIRPILIIVALPLEILTLGLFTFVINAGLVLLTSAIVPDFRVSSFWWALVFSLVLWLINSILHVFEPSKKHQHHE